MATQKQQPQQTKPVIQRNWLIQKRNPGVDSPIRFKCTLTNTILDVLRNRPGWEEVRPEEENLEQIDFFWCDREWVHTHYDQMYFPDHVRIEHFRNHFELTRKNLMAKNLKRMRKQVEKEHGKLEAQKWDFFPTTYELPSEYHIFVEEFKRNQGTIWIMKPAARSQGKGIFLFRKLKDIMDWKKVDTFTQPDAAAQPPPETYVVSRYVSNPYLVGGRKFDMRIYVLVTSYNPLKVWLYREGFARFSITRFNLDVLEDSYVHLTNVAVQKTAPDYDPEKGCKWSTQRLREYLIAKHGIARTEELFRNIDDIFIKSLLSVQKVIINDKHCFEMYGYDILIDDNLKPWLLEINASPSLTASSKEDYDLKCRLLDDVLNIIDMEGRLTGREKAVGAWDLIWNDGPVSYEDPGNDSLYSANYSHNSFLGCYADRHNQLQKLYRDISFAKQQPVPPPAAQPNAASQQLPPKAVRNGNGNGNANVPSQSTIRKVSDGLNAPVDDRSAASQKPASTAQQIGAATIKETEGDSQPEANGDETDPNVSALLNYAGEENNENRYEPRDEE